MSDSVRPQRRQPTRLPRPWDSPGKKTGVGCHFLLQCIKVKRESEFAQSCLTPGDPMDCSLPGFSVHGIFQAREVEWVAIAFRKLKSLCSLKSFCRKSCTTVPNISLDPQYVLFQELSFIRVLVLSLLSHVPLFETQWTVACQAPLSMGFPRQEYWSGLPCSPPRDLPKPGTEPASPLSPALQLRFLPIQKIHPE